MPLYVKRCHMTLPEQSGRHQALHWAQGSVGEVLLVAGEKLLLRLGADAVAVGRGQPSVAMYRGNFSIQDSPEMVPLGHARRSDDEVLLGPGEGDAPLLL